MTIKTLTRSFAGGEITPELFGRLDLGKFQTGLATCRNFLPLPHGPVARRPGTKFVREVKSSANGAVLIPFAFSATDTVVIEFGNLYVRFHSQGGTVMSGGSPYEVVTPYTTADLADLHYTQSADVLTLVHPSYAIRELRRSGVTSWALSTVSFAPTLATPTGVSASATSGSATNLTTQTYVVTAVASNGIDESYASSSASCSNNLGTAGTFNTITWTAVTDAARYNVYKRLGGVFCYVGQASSTTFTDNNIAPDQTKVPPESFIDLNSGTGKYPSTAAYHEQRRWFAGTDNDPQTFYATRTATENNLTSSLPSQADDALEVRIAAQQQNRIRHLVPLSDMIALTAGGEWRIFNDGAPAITPTSISIKPQGYAGASNVTPVVTSGSILYVQAQGSRIRELAYNNDVQSYRSVDMSIMSPHMFNAYEIYEIAYSRAPDSVLWCVRDDGSLLSMTYVPEHQVYAWAKHDTDGEFESICVVSEGNEDVLYAVVKRTISGSTKRYVERLETRFFDALADAFFVDCGATYDGTPVDTISGLSWLEGKTVNILADGAVHPQRTVTSGSITLDYEASVIHVGLPIEADIKTLPLSVEGMQASGQGTTKNVSKVHLRVYQSSGVRAGPSFSKLTTYPTRSVDDDYGVPPALRTGELSMTVSPSWNSDAAVCVRQTEPLPLTILSMTLEVQTGG